MAKLFTELDDTITRYIAENDRIAIKSSKLSADVEKYLLKTIEEILKKHGKTNFLEMVYTITKELATNGIKANQKRVFFEDEGLNITNEQDYAKGIALYKQHFSEKMADEYGLRCLARNIYIQANLVYNETGLYIEVVNNTPVLPTEETRLREKMKTSAKYNDIAEFYMENMDNTEGAGLGIALIMIMLKSEHIDPHLFRIITEADKTIARVEIPFQ